MTASTNRTPAVNPAGGITATPTPGVTVTATGAAHSSNVIARSVTNDAAIRSVMELVAKSRDPIATRQLNSILDQLTLNQSQGAVATHPATNAPAASPAPPTRATTAQTPHALSPATGPIHVHHPITATAELKIHPTIRAMSEIRAENARLAAATPAVAPRTPTNATTLNNLGSASSFLANSLGYYQLWQENYRDAKNFRRQCGRISRFSLGHGSRR